MYTLSVYISAINFKLAICSCRTGCCIARSFLQQQENKKGLYIQL
jgi:hypothetical protein